jgi:DNA polymerase-1
MKKVLVLDAYNLIYRAKSGFTKGENAIVFMFFRSLRALIDKFKPDECYFVLEGQPQKNIEVLQEYKANRPKQSDSFHRQKNKIISMIREHFPITIVRHPYHECDDIAGNIARKVANEGGEAIVISSDTDFIQILQWETPGSIKLYNPVKKKFIEAPEYDYIRWKSMRGDKTDNIFGIPKFGDKTAEKYAMSDSLFESLMKDPEKESIVNRNKGLIEFADINCIYDEHIEIEFSNTYSRDKILQEFKDMEFSSMTKEKYFNSFTCTFQDLLVK